MKSVKDLVERPVMDMRDQVERRVGDQVWRRVWEMTEGIFARVENRVVWGQAGVSSQVEENLSLGFAEEPWDLNP